jgi:hypothetical protein
MILLLGVAEVRAEWVAYGTSSEVTYYFDPATVRQNGNMRRVLTLHNLNRRGSVGGTNR